MNDRDPPSVPVCTTVEWLAVWEALSQYVANSEKTSDPQAASSLEAAVAVLNRMDDLSVVLSQGAN